MVEKSSVGGVEWSRLVMVKYNCDGVVELSRVATIECSEVVIVEYTSCDGVVLGQVQSGPVLTVE